MANIRTALDFLGVLRDQWKSPDELLALQQSRMRNLIRHAYDNFVFYRDRFDRLGMRPENISGHDDLQRIPVVGKEALRQAIQEATTIPQNSQWVSTSGSTGIPMRIPFLRRDHSLINLTWLRPLLAHGIPLSARTLEITGPHNIRFHSYWYQRLGLWRRRSVSIFESPERWIELLNKERPDVLWGYSGSLKILAQFIKKNKSSVFLPRWVVGVSDLVDTDCRELIQEVFKTKLIDLYGAAETGCISWFCSVCEEYHINIDHLIVEIIPTHSHSGFTNPHKIIVTNLHSFAFPIIRYDIGDLGFPLSRPAACGRGLPLMKIIEGRSDAMIRLPSGRVLSPMFFFAAMKKVTGLTHWQVIQEKPDQLTVNVVPDETGKFAAVEAETILLETIAEPMRIKIQVVNFIPGSSSGKQCAVISKVDNEG